MESDLWLCADGGGTSVSVTILSSTGVVAKGRAGPCNVKTVGPTGAIQAILAATYMAYNQIFPTPVYSDADEIFPFFPSRIFKSVWLGLAGIMQPLDVDAFTPYAEAAFCVSGCALRITNDGFLLASPSLRLPEIDSTIALVAGTGVVGLAFKKCVDNPKRLEQVGVSRGWGYLLCDEGSAYSIGRLAIRSILSFDDAISCATLSQPPSAIPTKILDLHKDLLDYFKVSDCASLVDKVYSNHSTPTSRTISSAEANRKIWIAEATRIVFGYAFGKNKLTAQEEDLPSTVEAITIATEAIQSLINIVIRLLGDRSIIIPSRTALCLGGGLWNTSGYLNLLLDSLRELGVVFSEIIVVEDPAEEGVRAIYTQSRESCA